MSKADPKGVLTGSHFMDGDFAIAEGGLAAGCRFFAGYPITPSTETAEHFSSRIPMVGGLFIQMEDELASIAALIGASWGGKKVMTITSGPGFSLMMENLGLAVMQETPLVIANVQRGGPSTGLPTLTGQQDMMQARWGSHGDYRIIALSPDSPQECFDLTIEAFNLSEIYRVPVLVMTDECVGHMHEKVVIPPAEEINLVERKWYTGPKDKYLPYKNDKKIIRLEEMETEGAEVIVMSYGITSRVAYKAVQDARSAGIKVGTCRLITVWPFPEKRVKELARKAKAIVFPEINAGQVVQELQRIVADTCKVVSVPHYGGWVHDPDVILKAIKEAVK
jgi:2-oxoglutarate ferredoxin oxidoreductase subunit alpha